MSKAAARALDPATDAAKTHASRVLRLLAKAYPEAPCELNHSSPFQLLAATILSAQCTDKRVNLVTPALFAQFPDAHAMAKATLAQLELLVASTGFFRAKSKNLQAMAQMLVVKYAGVVPQTLAQLIELPGVARKTASVVLGVCFNKAEGVVVDTHVMRLSQRLGLTSFDDAKRIERDLMQVIAKKHWIIFSHRIIYHGRAICRAAKPACGTCTLAGICPSMRLP